MTIVSGPFGPSHLSRNDPQGTRLWKPKSLCSRRPNTKSFFMCWLAFIPPTVAVPTTNHTARSSGLKGPHEANNGHTSLHTSSGPWNLTLKWQPRLQFYAIPIHNSNSKKSFTQISKEHPQTMCERSRTFLLCIFCEKLVRYKFDALLPCRNLCRPTQRCMGWHRRPDRLERHVGKECHEGLFPPE